MSSIADYPELAAQWHPDRNGNCAAASVGKGSGKKVWWLCPASTCGHPHEWSTAARDRVRYKSGCPFCKKQRCCPCGSISGSPIAAEWHPARNGRLLPEDVSPGSSKKIWWLCPRARCEHPHEWYAPVWSRTQGNRCPYCYGCAFCPCKSLPKTHPDLADEWDDVANKGLTPTDVHAGSTKKVWWVCACDCGELHEWRATVKDRVKGTGCPYCRPGGICCPGCSSLAVCYPAVAAEWDHDKNDGGPEGCSPYSCRRVGWVCAKGHCWEAAIGNRTDKDSRCPKCRRSKLEDALEEALVSLGHDPLGEQRFEDLGKRLAYDNAILLPSGLMVLFEADGEQHFRPVDFSNHRKPAEVQANYEASLKRDIAKNDYVRVSGRALLRIPWTRLADIPTLVEDFLSGGPQAGSVTYIDEGMYTAAYATAASPGHIGDDDPIWAELELA